MPSSAIVFPLYIAEPKHFEIAGECYRKLKKRAGDTQIIVVNDGLMDPEAHEYFLKERSDGNCMYIAFGTNHGLTRSWNTGADLAEYMGVEVVILGNQDAYPETAEDLKTLVNDCAEHPEFYAVGPKTNKPGHVKAQAYDGRGEGLTKIPYINGFTWAIRTERVKKTIEKRGFFLYDSKQHVFHFSKQEVIKDPGLRPHESLAMVGQEDEIFKWARDQGMVCAISNGSYWYHEKLSLFRVMV